MDARAESHEPAILFQSKVNLAHSRMDTRASSFGGFKSNFTASWINCIFCSGSVISKWNWYGCAQLSLVFFEWRKTPPCCDFSPIAAKSVVTGMAPAAMAFESEIQSISANSEG